MAARRSRRFNTDETTPSLLAAAGNGYSRKSGSPSVEKSASSRSRFTALVLTVPGIVIYAYILYTMVSKLAYPGSFSPFANSPRQPLYSSDGNVTDPTLARAVLVNSGLMALFFFQHTLMAHLPVKRLFDKLGISAITRPLYVTCTCIAINIVNSYWQVTPNSVLWFSNSWLLNQFLMVVHTACWMSITCSVFTTDYLELLGIKQLYYAYCGFQDPMYYKSSEQQQLLRHNRHPIFLGPLIILWAVPVMTYDRLLLALMLPLYVGCGSIINDEDVGYVKTQFTMKRRQLLANGVGRSS